MSESADFIARHIVMVLSIVALIVLGAMVLLWRVIESDRAIVIRLWHALRASSAIRRLKSAPFLGPVVNQALTLTRFLGVFALLAFGAAVAALSAFFVLADEIELDDSLARFDELLAAEMSQHASRELLDFFAGVTLLGEPEVLRVLSVVVAMVLILLKRRLVAIAWIVTTAGGGLMTVLLKPVFERPRPVHEHGLVAETTWSFPSGHASGSMLVYGVLAYLVVRHAPPAWRLPIAAVAVVLIVFVGFSRVVLHVHYLSDVLAGYACAVVWSASCIALLEAVRWREISQSQAEPTRAAGARESP